MEKKCSNCVNFEEYVYQYLPDEIFVEILRFLDAGDIYINIKKVNKRFRTLCKEEVIWEHLCHSKMLYCKEIDLLEKKKILNCKNWRELFLKLCSWVVKNNDFFIRPGAHLGPRVRKKANHSKYRSILSDRLYSFGKHSLVLQFFSVPSFMKVTEFKKKGRGKPKKIQVKKPTYGIFSLGFVFYRKEIAPEIALRQDGFCYIGNDPHISRGHQINLSEGMGKKNSGKKKKLATSHLKCQEWIIKLNVDLDFKQSEVFLKKAEDLEFSRILANKNLFAGGNDYSRGISFGVSLMYSDTVNFISCI